MSAIDPKESAKYAGRLFGYFLTVTVIGGGITIGGAALLWNNGVLSGGSVDVGSEVIVGSALTGVGALIILAGFFTIILNVIADGVRFGVAETASEAEDGPEQPRVPAWPPSQYRPAAGQAPPVRQRTPVRESGHRQPADRNRDPEVEESNEDDAWKREVEEKLADEDRPRQGGKAGTEGTTSPKGQAAERNEPRGARSESERARERRSGTTEDTGNVGLESSDRSTGRTESGVEREPEAPSRQEPENAAGTGEPPAAGDPDRTDSEAWVSGEDVGSEEPMAERNDRDEESETSTSEGPLTSGETETPDSTDDEEEDTDSPAWLERTEEGEDEESR
mgnify:CR=1 FL=1